MLFHLKHNAIKIHGPCFVKLYNKDSEIKRGIHCGHLYTVAIEIVNLHSCGIFL